MSICKVSDYIMRFLVNHGIKHLFLLSGGGMMHLLDAAKRCDDLELVFNLNEQASGICGESYSQFTENLGACMLTTGPGATNAVTGCAGAWLDSTPVIYISGQCRTQQMGQLHGLRIYGAQEVAIIPCVKPITKYAVTILQKEEIRYHLEKAVYLANNGRKGPVWIDVPLDVQGADVELDSLAGFDPVAEGYTEPELVPEKTIAQVYELLNSSKRPAILIGHGVVASKSQQLIRDLSESIRIPVLSTWRAKGVFGDDEPLYMGCPGVPGPRYSNYVNQNTDFLLIIGTRLNPAITAYDERGFAPNAKKVMVDIEAAEIDKLDMDFTLKIVTDAKLFLSAMFTHRNLYRPIERERWLTYCAKMKEKYPISKEVQPLDQENKVDAYRFGTRLSDFSTADDVFVGSSSGRSCGISHLSYNLKKGQRFVTSMGLGSMGWVLPSAIACCFASGKKRTLLMDGDGSLQHNIQELQLISTYKLPIKIFVIENGGYASIFSMQRNNFHSRFAGCNPESGVSLPRIEEIAMLYHLDYHCIHNDDEIDSVLKEVMADDRPCLCEVDCSINFDEIPKTITVANPDGTFEPVKLTKLYPFVSPEEQKENMPDWSQE